MNMIIRCVKVILLEVLTVIGIEANTFEDMVLDEGDFGLLCNTSKVMTGLLQTVSDASLEINEISEKEHELSVKIDETFFGVERTGGYGGYSVLPEQLRNANPSRNEVCVSQKKSHGMPSASDSLASAIFCLCMRTVQSGEDLCNIPSQNKISWPDTSQTRVAQNEFETAWDIVVMKQCIGHESANLENQKQNLADNLTKLKEKLEKKIPVKKENSCNESNTCAKVTKNPSWLNSLREIGNITNGTLTLLEEHKKKLKSVLQKTEAPVPSNSVSGVTSETKTAPSTVQAKTQVSGGRHKDDQRKVTEVKPKTERKGEQEPEKKSIGMPKKEEKPIPIPDLNETSENLINTPKLCLWTALIF
ncbi:unnamed protein product [Trypanosoma congolense IL3000]|uniref:WGS project CAEQ00000000 data, annotated contig 2259 n=1 Tax=Trypanosoma congolense (strain IL3000) TaxID=1068625 RepID=F9WCQ7_TRYCI|nr:unnamed protein product [Trypanosoma congolense IL3000]